MKNSFLISSIAHLLFLTLLFFSFHFQSGIHERKRQMEVRFVRLHGGGQNRPGWIKPTPAPPDHSPVSDGQPKKVETHPKVSKPQEQSAAIKSEPNSKILTEPESETTNDEVKEKEEENLGSVAALDQSQKTGEGVGAKPGPEGPGIGIISDADFPGGEIYLSRLEAEVQRRFNFRGRGSGQFAEYHFFIERDGNKIDLVQMRSSQNASLDLASRSALMRAKFPPLPETYPFDKLGVTYRFYDAE